MYVQWAYNIDERLAAVGRSARKDDRFNLRVSPRQRNLIRRAAEQAGLSYTDFILDSAAEKAVDVLADQRLFLLDDDGWRRFMAALEARPEPVPALVELFTDREL